MKERNYIVCIFGFLCLIFVGCVVAVLHDNQAQADGAVIEVPVVAEVGPTYDPATQAVVSKAELAELKAAVAERDELRQAVAIQAAAKKVFEEPKQTCTNNSCPTVQQPACASGQCYQRRGWFRNRR